MGPISANPYISIKANIKGAIGFYETGYDGIATVYLVEGKRVNSLSEALTPQGTSVDRSKSRVMSSLKFLSAS